MLIKNLHTLTLHLKLLSENEGEVKYLELNKSNYLRIKT